MRILIVEDNKPQLELLHKLLEEEGFEVAGCTDGASGLYELDTGAYDLAVLDRMLPELDGVTLLRRHRDNGGYTPVIMLTALSALGDRVAGLDAGADDYLAKPFAPEELLARIRALLRRPSAVKSTGFRQGDVELFRQRGVLKGPAGECTISGREAALLYLFLSNPSAVLSRETILMRIWGQNSDVEERNIDNFVYLIRRRLSNVGSRIAIRTVRGCGYRAADSVGCLPYRQRGGGGVRHFLCLDPQPVRKQPLHRFSAGIGIRFDSVGTGRQYQH